MRAARVRVLVTAASASDREAKTHKYIHTQSHMWEKRTIDDGETELLEEFHSIYIHRKRGI